jgi:hypothetical protein
MAYTRIVGSNPTVSARLQIRKPPSGGFFICNLAETSKAPSRLAGVAKAEDSKTCAYLRTGGPRNVGESLFDQ